MGAWNTVGNWVLCVYLADHGHTGLCFPRVEVRVKDFHRDQLRHITLSSEDIDQPVQLYNAKVLAGLQHDHEHSWFNPLLPNTWTYSTVDVMIEYCLF